MRNERQNMKFMGYRRSDGTVGIRNHVIIIPSVVCANRVARGISQLVTGATWVEHQHAKQNETEVIK